MPELRILPRASRCDLRTGAQIVPCTEAEGPGARFALWFQGCPLRCPGCCNPEMLPFEGGTLTVPPVAVQLEPGRSAARRRGHHAAGRRAAGPRGRGGDPGAGGSGGRA